MIYINGQNKIIPEKKANEFVKSVLIDYGFKSNLVIEKIVSEEFGISYKIHQTRIITQLDPMLKEVTSTEQEVVKFMSKAEYDKLLKTYLEANGYENISFGTFTDKDGNYNYIVEYLPRRVQRRIKRKKLTIGE